jgi:hypothetical protein
MPKKKEIKVNLVKPVPGYKGVPTPVLEQRVIDINMRSLAEIERLEKLAKTYEALVILLEKEWAPKKTIHKNTIRQIAALKVAAKKLGSTVL